MARTMLGNQHVQGLDYAYTLQGWLKGVNSTAVGTGQYDAGNDGLAGSANHQVARDAFGFSLQYYGSDYTPIKNTNSFAAITGGFAGNAKPLYNGNISSMAVNIPRLGEGKSICLHLQPVKPHNRYGCIQRLKQQQCIHPCIAG